MYQTLYRKWRPSQWDQVIGQEHITSTLQNAVKAERVAHAYLFAGPRGTGKTSTARILAKAVNCLDEDLSQRPCDQCEHCLAINTGRYLDLIEIDAASNTSVEDVRDLREKINFSPNAGRYKVYIIDEVHMLSTAAFNALLKTLEEPPPHAIFILATTEIHKIPATIHSRCQRHEFRRIPVAELVNQLVHVAESENIDIEPEALQLIARQATGSMRDGISLLDHLSSSKNHVTLEFAERILGTVANQSVIELVDCAIAQDAKHGLQVIQKTLDAGSDSRIFSRQIVDYLRNVILVKMGNIDQLDMTKEILIEVKRHAQQVSTNQLLEMVRSFNQSSTEARNAWQPSLPLELALLEVIQKGNGEEGKQIDDSKQNPGQLSIKHMKRTPNAPDFEDPERESESRNANLASSNSSGLTIKNVNEIWRKYLAFVGQQNKQLQALLNSCKPFGVKGTVVYLGFNGDFAKSKLEQPDNLELTQTLLSQLLDTQISIRCFVVNNKQDGIPPDVDSDGMVAAVLRDLGGEIVDVR
jgi:DNA polymerase-3 subunit gamma/tau